MRKKTGDKYYCSSCSRQIEVFHTKCNKCGEKASTEIIKDISEVLDIYNCNFCNQIVLKSDKKCSNCTNDFSGVFHKCPYCERLVKTDKELCFCGKTIFKKKKIEKNLVAKQKSESTIRKKKPLSTRWLSTYNYFLDQIKFKQRQVLQNDANKSLTNEDLGTFEKIKKISELRDEGSITEKEFESKKKELLNRI